MTALFLLQRLRAETKAGITSSFFKREASSKSVSSTRYEK